MSNYTATTADLIGRLQGLAAELALADYEARVEVTSPDAAADVIYPLLDGLDREVCIVLHLDTKHRLLRSELVSVGSVDHTFMTPREVFRSAVSEGSSAVLLAHNHPSGSPDPSDDDRRITKRLVSAGELLGIEVLDHLIFGAGRWVSLARKGDV